MAEIRVYRQRNQASDKRRYTTGRNYFTCDSEYDPRWPGKEATRSLPARDLARRPTLLPQSPPDPICGRLRHPTESERATRRRGQTPCGAIHEETRTANLTRENTHYAYGRRIPLIGQKHTKL